MELKKIELDADLQPRANIDAELIEEYSMRIFEGAILPPIMVYFDGASHWLADGYHRYHAHKALDKKEITAEIRNGTKKEAVEYSLGANSEHGKQRCSGDYKKAYETGQRYGLFQADEAQKVAEVLYCTLRWANKLTKRARDRKKEKRNNNIVRLAGEGKTLREIAQEAGLGKSRVEEITNNVRFRNTSETGQKDRDKLPPRSYFDRVYAGGDVLRAVKKISEGMKCSPKEAAGKLEGGQLASILTHLEPAIGWLVELERELKKRNVA